MIDGVKCSCFGLNADLWQNNPHLDFGLSISESTGELLTQKREAKAKDLRFVLSRTGGGGFSCSFAGSLHKHKNIDGNNWDGFTFTELCSTLDSLTTDYNIDLDNTHIHGIEIGVNLELDFCPEIVFKQAICHKGKRFEQLDRKDKKVGIVCTHSNYLIKLYDKGYQCKRKGKNILRYEVKLFRQRLLEPYGIATLADLKDVDKTASLIGILLDHLNEIVFFDFSYKCKELTTAKRLHWMQYSNPNYWESLNKRSYYKARQKLAELKQKYKCTDWLKFVSTRTTKKWFELVNIKQEKGGLLPRLFEALESRKRGTFAELEYLLVNVPFGDVSKAKEKTLNIEPKKGACYCITCGRQLTNQKQGSRFCSERICGKEAKKCRNKDSNRRLTIKRKLFRAMDKDLMLRVTYESNGKEYSDILGANEICATREWLDKVKRVELLKHPPETLNRERAKNYLVETSKTNDYGKLPKKET